MWWHVVGTTQASLWKYTENFAYRPAGESMFNCVEKLALKSTEKLAKASLF